MISRSFGSKFTVHGKKVFTSRAIRTGVREDKNTSKFRMSPSISSRGSTSLVVGIFFEILKKINTRQLGKLQISEIYQKVIFPFQMLPQYILSYP